MPANVVAVSSPSFSRDARLRQAAIDAFAPKWQLRFCPTHHELAGEQLAAFLADASIAIVGKETINRPLLERLPCLEAISKYGVGLDNIDFSACSHHNIHVYYESGVNAQAVAELTIGLTIDVLRKISEGDRILRARQWKKNGGRQLSGKTVAIIGCGAIGSRVAYLLKAFGCPLLLCDTVDKSSLARDVEATLCSFDEAITRADVVTLHVPLTDATHEMINHHTLALMKPSSIVINTSRGFVVDLEAAKQALQKGSLWGLGLDVFPYEPLNDDELFLLPNVVATPHVGGNAEEAILAMGLAALRGAKEWSLRKK